MSKYGSAPANCAYHAFAAVSCSGRTWKMQVRRPRVMTESPENGADRIVVGCSDVSKGPNATFAIWQCGILALWHSETKAPTSLAACGFASVEVRGPNHEVPPASDRELLERQFLEPVV